MFLKICIFGILLLSPIFGAPVSQEQLDSTTDGLKDCNVDLPCDKSKFQQCIEGQCQCDDPTNQIYDMDLQQCAYLVGSNCSAVLGANNPGEEIINGSSSTFNFVLVISNSTSKANMSKCVVNSECNSDRLECECIEGYGKTEKSTCMKLEKLGRNDISAEDEEIENFENIPFAKSCKSDEECDNSQGLQCMQFSVNSSHSVCDCLNSTYIYTLEKGCFLPYGITIRELLLRKYAMRNYRAQKNFNFRPERLTDLNSTGQNAIGDRTQLQQGTNSNSNQQAYQILDRNQYRPQSNPFGQFPQNNYNPQLTSGEQFSNANNFQGQQTQPQQPIQQQQNVQIPVTSNNAQFPNTPANNPQNQLSNNQNFPINNNNNFPNNNNYPSNLGGYNPNSVSPQYPNPSYGQFQQPTPQFRPNEPPRFSLLSLFLNPLTQLLNPQQNSDGTRSLNLPFMREKRGIIAFFARLLNTFLPVLRTLDYQIAPVLTELGKFRYFDNTNNNNNNNYGNSQQNQNNYNNNQQQNIQGMGNAQNNQFSYQANPFQYPG